MSERLSPLTQRVRRLLGTTSLAPAPINDAAPRPLTRAGDTAALFEARVAKLSHLIEELRAVDLQREDELRALREQIARAQHRSHPDLATILAPTIAELDIALLIGRGLLAPPSEPPQTTLFERMRARVAAHNPETLRQREQLAALVDRLATVRSYLAALAAER